MLWLISEPGWEAPHQVGWSRHSHGWWPDTEKTKQRPWARTRTGPGAPIGEYDCTAHGRPRTPPTLSPRTPRCSILHTYQNPAHSNPTKAMLSASHSTKDHQKPNRETRRRGSARNLPEEELRWTMVVAHERWGFRTGETWNPDTTALHNNACAWALHRQCQRWWAIREVRWWGMGELGHSLPAFHEIHASVMIDWKGAALAGILISPPTQLLLQPTCDCVCFWFWCWLRAWLDCRDGLRFRVMVACSRLLSWVYWAGNPPLDWDAGHGAGDLLRQSACPVGKRNLQSGLDFGAPTRSLDPESHGDPDSSKTAVHPVISCHEFSEPASPKHWIGITR